MIVVWSSNGFFTTVNSRQKLSDILKIMPDVKYKRVESISEINAMREKVAKYESAGHSLFKDISKENLRYVDGSYSIKKDSMTLYFDTKRVGNIILPRPTAGQLSRVGTVNRVFVPGSYSGSIRDNCTAITSLIRLCPRLLPLQINISDSTVYSMLNSYSGNEWFLKDVQEYLKSPGTWIYIKEKFLNE